ncbi:MAG: DUF1572 family protein [Bryobacteraceae bacterium]|nr:DUF1572 family protein [Bryobacteraceae bacterium]
MPEGIVTTDGDAERIFLAYSAAKLKQLSGRIAACLDRLSYEQVWARGGESENAVGNLTLHLCGNVRQWIGTGVAGRPDVRVRDREFRARGDIQPAELRERLEGVAAEAAAIIEGLAPERLTETVVIQNYSLTILEAIYHVVEHFAQHAGQILFATKQLTGEDLGFYRHLASGAAPHSETTP